MRKFAKVSVAIIAGVLFVVALLGALLPLGPDEKGCVHSNEFFAPGIPIETRPGMVCDMYRISDSVVHVSCCPRK